MTTPESQPPKPPARLQLPTRLSDQVPGLATYGGHAADKPAMGANGAIRTSDRDEKEQRKVRAILTSVGLFVALIIAVVILAGSHSQPSPEERMAWNRAELALLQRCLMKVNLKRYQTAMADPVAANDSSRAVRLIMVESLRRELDRLTVVLNSPAAQADGELWNRTRQAQRIAERALAWTDGYDRPFQVDAAGLRLTIRSLGANGRIDTDADLPKDDVSATVLMSSGEPMEVKKWEEVFTLPDMSQVQIFDPGNPETMEKLRSQDPDRLTPRERMMERRYKIQDLMDEGHFDEDLDRKLREYELKEGIPQPGDTKPRPKLTDQELQQLQRSGANDIPTPPK